MSNKYKRLIWPIVIFTLLWAFMEWVTVACFKETTIDFRLVPIVGWIVTIIAYIAEASGWYDNLEND